MRGHQVLEFEKKLKSLFDGVDRELEDRWGDTYSLHPARPAQGEAANPEDDGLFNVGAAFSAGYGSESGRGYVIEMRMSTLSVVPETVRNTITSYVAGRVRTLLSEYFPDKELDVVQDGGTFKIIGDLRL